MDKNLDFNLTNFGTEEDCTDVTVQDSYIEERLKAAQSGDPEAYYDLGLVYSTGRGVEIDLVEAHKWFNLAVMNGMKKAQIDRSELAHDMSPLEIAEAQRQARAWMDKSDLKFKH